VKLNDEDLSVKFDTLRNEITSVLKRIAELGK